jgi:hypothetical protein
MYVERFASGVLKSGVLDTYVAVSFFGTVIYFVLNIHLYTPMEILMWTFIVAIGAKGLANLMLGLVIALYDLGQIEEKNNFEKESERIDQLLAQLKFQEIEKTNEKMIKQNG